MTSIFDQIKTLLNANEGTVIFTWDTVHLIITVLIFIALIILIWIHRLDRCVKKDNNDRSNGEPDNEESSPRCIDSHNSVFM